MNTHVGATKISSYLYGTRTPTCIWYSSRIKSLLKSSMKFLLYKCSQARDDALCPIALTDFKCSNRDLKSQSVSFERFVIIMNFQGNKVLSSK